MGLTRRCKGVPAFPGGPNALLSAPQLFHNLPLRAKGDAKGVQSCLERVARASTGFQGFPLPRCSMAFQGHPTPATAFQKLLKVFQGLPGPFKRPSQAFQRFVLQGFPRPSKASERHSRAFQGLPKTFVGPFSVLQGLPKASQRLGLSRPSQALQGLPKAVQGSRAFQKAFKAFQGHSKGLPTTSKGLTGLSRAFQKAFQSPTAFQGRATRRCGLGQSPAASAPAARQPAHPVRIDTPTHGDTHRGDTDDAHDIDRPSDTKRLEVHGEGVPSVVGQVLPVAWRCRRQHRALRSPGSPSKT